MESTRAERLVLGAPGHLAWVGEELPAIGPDEVLVRTRAAAISLGSELPVYEGTARASRAIQYPRGVGYESVGVVEACGAAVRRVRCGERVVATYGHCTLAAVPEARVMPVPAGISDALAILSILTCDAAKGVRQIAPRPEETALITGMGAMGLLALFILRAYGVAEVDVVEPRAERRELARLLGARRVWAPGDADGARETYAVGFECSSRNAAFALAQRRLRRRGRLCVLADGNREPLVLAPEFHEKELRVVGSSDGWNYARHAAWYFDYLQRHPTALERLFELRVARGELIATFARLARGELQPVKVLVLYEEAL